jgi:lipoyl(octanoyl) transferase
MRWAWLGRVRYPSAWELQESLRAAILDGRAEETLLLCEHEPVITLGRSADRRNVLVRPDELARRGIDVVASSRGGDVTYHGPGQLVGYPVFRVRSVVAHVQGMADAITEVIAPIRGRWRRDCPGVWVGEHKLAAFGVHIRRGVAIHGFALNVTTALDAFSLIVPCGLSRTKVTSLSALGAMTPPLPELAARVATAFAARRGQPERRIDAHAILNE